MKVGIWIISYSIPKNIGDRISAMVIPENNSLKDRLKWALTPNGKFSIKSAYDHIISSNMDKIHESKISTEFGLSSVSIN